MESLPFAPFVCSEEIHKIHRESQSLETPGQELVHSKLSNTCWMLTDTLNTPVAWGRTLCLGNIPRGRVHRIHCHCNNVRTGPQSPLKMETLFTSQKELDAMYLSPWANWTIFDGLVLKKKVWKYHRHKRWVCKQSMHFLNSAKGENRFQCCG